LKRDLLARHASESPVAARNILVDLLLLRPAQPEERRRTPGSCRSIIWRGSSFAAGGRRSRADASFAAKSTRPVTGLRAAIHRDQEARARSEHFISIRCKALWDMAADFARSKSTSARICNYISFNARDDSAGLAGLGFIPTPNSCVGCCDFPSRRSGLGVGSD